jgi:hypothetical protein
MSHPTTGSQRLADLLLQQNGRTLGEYLTEKRARGLSYERIARDLQADTDNEVVVSYTTVKRWFEDLEVVA